MKRTKVLALIVLLAFSLLMIAGSCDVETKTVKLRQLDKKLKQYETTEWDGLQKTKVKYVVSGNKDVDEFALQSALIYATYVQADYISARVSKDMKELKKNKNSEAKKKAQENLKIAQDILTKAAANAPKLVEAGNKLVNNIKSIVTDVTKLPSVLKALQDSLKNLYTVIDKSPDLIKKLGKQISNIAKA